MFTRRANISITIEMVLAPCKGQSMLSVAFLAAFEEPGEAGPRPPNLGCRKLIEWDVALRDEAVQKSLHVVERVVECRLAILCTESPLEILS